MIKLLRTLIGFFKLYNKQKKFLKSFLAPLLHKYANAVDGSLVASDLYKMQHYYGLGSVVLVGEAIAVLHGRAISNQERESLTLMACLTGPFDDFFDQEYLSDTHIKNLMKANDPSIIQNTKQQLCFDFYKQILSAGNQTEVIAVAEEVFTTQKASLSQKKSSPSLSDIQKICDDKGGAAMLFYRAGFKSDYLTSEKEILFKTGEIYQLCNDIFDVYKDIYEGIKTPVILCSKISDIDSLLKFKLSELKSVLTKAKVDTKTQQKYLSFLYVSVARSMVCIKQYKLLEQTTTNEFKASKYTRKQLICDMELTKNKINFLSFYRQLNQ